MQNGSDTALRLMIVDDSVEDAEAIVSAMRNAGIAVRPLRPASADELGAMLGAQVIDLVLAAQQSEGLALEEVLKLVKSSGKDLPVIAVADRVDEASMTQAIAAGARRIALRHKPQQLLGAVRIEWADLEARRALRRLEAQVRETERRTDRIFARADRLRA
jgi:PleD family two-component response regulator